MSERTVPSRTFRIEVVTGVVADDAFDARLHLLGHEAVQACLILGPPTADPTSTATRTGTADMCSRIESSLFLFVAPTVEGDTRVRAVYREVGAVVQGDGRRLAVQR